MTDNDPIRLTDAGNAQAFVRDHGTDLRWCPEWGTWLRWGGTHWARTPHESMIPLAIRTARSFYARAAAPDLEPELAKALAAHAKSSESAGKLNAMIQLARGLCVAQAADFDRDPWLLNLANGTVELRLPGDFREHRREDMITKIAPVAFDGNAAAPTWEAFLARVLPDADVRAWFQRFCGYALSGDTSEQCLVFAHGKGANGKTTAFEALLHVFGDYGRPAAPDLLLAKNGEQHPTELADLQGARLVTAQEVEAGRAWAEKTVKAITGSDLIKARFMRCDFFSFKPTHKIVVAANHRPKVRGADEGIWRRIRLVPFTVTIPREERDHALPDKLRAEANGILRWCVLGCIAWQEHGLGDAPAIKNATAAYRADQDHLAPFIEDELEVGEKLFESTTALFDAYRAWCARNGHEAWKRDAFKEALLERVEAAAEHRGTGGMRGIRGLRIRRLHAVGVT